MQIVSLQSSWTVPLISGEGAQEILLEWNRCKTPTSIGGHFDLYYPQGYQFPVGLYTLRSAGRASICGWVLFSFYHQKPAVTCGFHKSCIYYLFSLYLPQITCQAVGADPERKISGTIGCSPPSMLFLQPYFITLVSINWVTFTANDHSYNMPNTSTRAVIEWARGENGNHHYTCWFYYEQS